MAAGGRDATRRTDGASGALEEKEWDACHHCSSSGVAELHCRVELIEDKMRHERMSWCRKEGGAKHAFI